jgi:hypothetical protein
MFNVNGWKVAYIVRVAVWLKGAVKGPKTGRDASVRKWRCVCTGRTFLGVNTKIERVYV